MSPPRPQYTPRSSPAGAIIVVGVILASAGVVAALVLAGQQSPQAGAPANSPPSEPVDEPTRDVDGPAEVERAIDAWVERMVEQKVDEAARFNLSVEELKRARAVHEQHFREKAGWLRGALRRAEDVAMSRPGPIERQRHVLERLYREILAEPLLWAMIEENGAPNGSADQNISSRADRYERAWEAMR